MIGYYSYDTRGTEKTMSCEQQPVCLSTDFYMISYKKIISGDIYYGRTKYDYKNGSLIFMAPRQESVTSGVKMEAVGASVFFHEDFVKGHEIRDRIKKCSFFNYTTNEALHLSPREEKQMLSIFNSIGEEYHTNPDEFSKEIILAQIDTLLKYANRYYKRQFIHRKEMAGDTLSQFQEIISRYFESGKFEENGTPQIEDIAEQLNMSPRYFSDTLKAETGKSAKEHIHLYLLDEAKNLLLEPNLTVAEAAYKLGFEYPAYFSRLFKKKVGISPSEYQRQNMVH